MADESLFTSDDLFRGPSSWRDDELTYLGTVGDPDPEKLEETQQRYMEYREAMIEQKAQRGVYCL